MVESKAVFLVYQDETGTYGTHEYGWEVCDEPRPTRQDAFPVGSVLQEMRDCEEGEGRQNLVEPRDIEPKHLETADVQHGDGNGKERGREDESLQERFLVVMAEVGHNHSSCTESAAASTHRGCHNAKNSEDKSRIAQPIVAHPLNQKAGIHLDCSASRHRIVELFIRRRARNVEHIDKFHRSRSPNECNHAFGHHRSVEATKAVLLVLDATRHHGTLRGVESAYCSAGNCDEDAWEERRIADRIMVGKSFCKAGNIAFVRKDAKAYQHGHDEQSRSEYRINGSDDFVDGKDCYSQIEDENQDRPNQVGISHIEQSQCQLLHQSGWNQHETCAHTNHQDERHNSHYQSANATQFVADYFRESHSTSPNAYHARHIVVHGSAKNATEYYPKESCRAIEDAHHGSEDRSCACDIEELDRIDFPSWHRDVVGSVLLRVARRSAVRINAKHLLDKCAVNKVTKHQTG